jgi:hypothetical protein
MDNAGYALLFRLTILQFGNSLSRYTTTSRKRICISIAMCVVIAAAGLAYIRWSPTQTLSNDQHSNTTSKAAAASHPLPSGTAETTTVTSGVYKGWTHYHNKELGFSINASSVVTIGDYTPASESDPPYATFLMDLFSDKSGRTIEFLHLAVYQADLQTSASRHDTARSDIYQVEPVKQEVTISGHKALLYYYDSDVRAALYLIDDGPRTFAINGFVHTKDPESVANYWEGFENTVNSFAID